MDKDDANQTADRKKGSGVKLVYDVLRDEIIDLSLAPGSPIDENQLAERFSMSRTPIRAALVRLAGPTRTLRISARIRKPSPAPSARRTHWK